MKKKISAIEKVEKLHPTKYIADLKQKAKNASEAIAQTQQTLRKTVRQHPIKSISVAAATGFISTQLIRAIRSL